MSTPRPGPTPRQHEGPRPLEVDGLLPDPVDLEEMPVRQHVAVFETLHARLAEQLDDQA